MHLDTLSDAEVMLAARALSIHRVSIRRKIDRLRQGTPEHASAVAELDATQQLVSKLNIADLHRVDVA